MSLEQAVQENTAALRELIVLLANPVHVLNAEKPIAKHVPKDAHPELKAAEVEVDKLNGSKAEPTSTGGHHVVTFDEMRAEFRKLVGVDRASAVNILANLGLRKLEEDQMKPEQYASILAEVQAELAKHG